MVKSTGQMKKFSPLLLLLGLLASCTTPQPDNRYIRVSGEHLLTAEGDTFFIRGTNLGNWLNPEGYMFGFHRCNSVGRINDAFCQLIGPDETARFWQIWKENYITREDIRYIAFTGANTIRLPFHYKLFTPDYYLGSYDDRDGFRWMDSVITWCRPYDVHVILDMHDAPGGQTGDNIDDSYGYPWLMVSEPSKELFCSIWKRIAAYYVGEPLVLGYELMNEPIAHYFQDSLPLLNAQLEPLYKRAVDSIRTVDTCHIVLLGGAQWNGTFRGVFHDQTFDNKIMYTCHRYGQKAVLDDIRDLVTWRDSIGLPIYMGETGHNTHEWIADMCRVMADNNMGYTFWPYKKMGRSSWVGFEQPACWDSIVRFVEADRLSYQAIRELRPAQALSHEALFSLLDSCRLEHCTIDSLYITNMQLHP